MEIEPVKRWWLKPFHPFLLAAYPVLYLLSRNTEYVEMEVLLRPLIVVLAGAAVLFGILRLALGESHRAAAATSAIALAFFTFPLYSSEPYQTVLAPILLVLILGYIVVKKTEWERATRLLNPFALVLVLVCIASMLRLYSDPAQYALTATEDSPAARPQSDTPNIYYFILDAYGRQDVLSDFYGYDNAHFVEFLRDQGFLVHDLARSNYAWTILSLASTLNYEHAIVMAEEFEMSGTSQLAMVSLIRNNRAMAYLRGLGYTIHGYMPGYMRVNLVGADVLHRPWWAPSEFESALLNYTPLPSMLFKASLPTAYTIHRELQLNTLDELDRLHELDSPKLVYVHLMCPHPPFIFGPEGETRVPPEPRFTLKDAGALVGSVLTQEEYVEGYRDQVQYLNSRMMPAIAKLRQEDPGAVIVIQGDHGPASRSDFTSLERTNMKERFGILNAMYLPESNLTERDIQTPVNTFRHIFNLYFGASLDPLPDDSYFTLVAEPHVYYRLTFAEDM